MKPSKVSRRFLEVLSILYVLFVKYAVYKIVLIMPQSVDENLPCDHSNEIYSYNRFPLMPFIMLHSFL